MKNLLKIFGNRTVSKVDPESKMEQRLKKSNRRLENHLHTSGNQSTPTTFGGPKPQIIQPPLVLPQVVPPRAPTFNTHTNWRTQ